MAARKKPAMAGMVCRPKGSRARRRLTCEGNSRRSGSIRPFHPHRRMQPPPPADGECIRQEGGHKKVPSRITITSQNHDNFTAARAQRKAGGALRGEAAHPLTPGSRMTSFA
jgi:hypothetical protein